MGIRSGPGESEPIPAFSRLVGQEKAKTLLGRALESGQLAHAYLFRGPDGVGKQLFARSLAAAANCRLRLDMETHGRLASGSGAAGVLAALPCGRCPSCRKYGSGNHPDFLVISPDKGTIKIDRIRELIQVLSYPPYESSLRVVLLEDIHTMRAEAANSLLKTLEEPPENNLLILTAAAAREILPTIASRCQTIPFYNLRQDETVQVLMRGNPELDDDTARLLARLSEGCPGQALIMYRREMIALWREVIALLADPQTNGNRDVGLLLQVAAKMAALKEDLVPLLGLLRIWLRDLLVAGEEMGPDLRNAAESGLQTRNRKCWNSQQLFVKLRAVDRAEAELGRNCNRNLVSEVLLFQLQH